MLKLLFFFWKQRDRSEKSDSNTAVSENFKEETEARRLAESCQGEKAVIVKVEKKQKKTMAAAYRAT